MRFCCLWVFVQADGSGSASVPAPAPAPAPVDEWAVVGMGWSAWGACALVGVWAFYLLVFHFLSNMPLDQPLLYGVQAR